MTWFAVARMSKAICGCSGFRGKPRISLRSSGLRLLFFPFSLVGEGGENKRSERNALP
jgi:hypothetical protein